MAARGISRLLGVLSRSVGPAASTEALVLKQGLSPLLPRLLSPAPSPAHAYPSSLFAARHNSTLDESYSSILYPEPQAKVREQAPEFTVGGRQAWWGQTV